MEGFIADMQTLAPERSHSFKEFEAHFGEHYLQQVMRRYWIHPGGRALDLLRKVQPGYPLETILEQEGGACAADLSDTSHFHVDLFGNYIPGLCSGLAIALEDLGHPLNKEKYPLLQRLYSKGVSGIYNWSRKTYGFEAEQEQYVNKCDLCTEIRTYLANHHRAGLTELKPKEFYSLKN
jgi:hypothetical protein